MANDTGGGSGESVGRISVDVEADLGKFNESMDKFDSRVSAYADKSIKLQLNLEKNFSDKDRLVNVTAKWAAGTLTGLAEKLAARNYAVSISKVRVSQDALNGLRSTLNSLFDSYTGVIDVTARVTGIESAGGGPINLSGPINLGSAGPVNQTPSASTSRGSSRSSGGGSRPAKPIPPEPAATPGKGKGKKPRRSAAEIAAERAQLERDNEALRERAEQQEREQAQAENQALKAQMRQQTMRDHPRYKSDVIAGIKEKLLYTDTPYMASFRPEWLKMIAARPQQLQPGGQVPNAVMDAMHQRITELTGERHLTQARKEELRELRDMEKALEDPFYLRGKKPGSIYAEAGADTGIRRGHAKAGSRGATGDGTMSSQPLHGRVARTPETMHQRFPSQGAREAWNFYKARRATEYLRSIDPDFKTQGRVRLTDLTGIGQDGGEGSTPYPRSSRYGEPWEAAVARARAAAAQAGRAQLDTAAGVDWNATNVAPEGEAPKGLLTGFLELSGRPREQEEYVNKQRALIKARVGKGLTPAAAELAYRRKHRAANLLMPTSTARLPEEEQAMLLPVIASDQDVLDILSLNQMGAEAKTPTQGRTFAPTIGKKSGKSVQGVGWVTEAIESAGTRLDRSSREPAEKHTRTLVHDPTLPVTNENPEQMRATTTVTPWTGRGMHQGPKGNWVWDKTDTEKAQRVKGKMPVKRWLKHLASQPGAMRDRWVQEEMAKLGVTEDLTSLRGEAPTAPVMPEASTAELSGLETARGEYVPRPGEEIVTPAHERMPTKRELREVGAFYQDVFRRTGTIWQGMPFQKQLGTRWKKNRQGNVDENAGPQGRTTRYTPLNLEVPESRRFQDVPAAEVGGPVPRGVEAAPKFEQSFEDSVLTNNVRFRTTEAGNLKYQEEGSRKWKQAGKARAAAYYRMRGQEQPETSPSAGAEPTPLPEPIPISSERMAQEQKAAEGYQELTGPAEGGPGGGGDSGGGETRVRVVNFSDLNKMLTGQTTGNGSLARVFKGLNMTSEGQQGLEGSPEDIARQLGLSMEQFQAVLRGETAAPAGAEPGAPPEGVQYGPPHPGDSLQRGRLDPRSREVWPKLSRTPRVAVSPAQKAAERAEEKRAEEARKSAQKPFDDASEYAKYLEGQAVVHARAADKQAEKDDKNYEVMNRAMAAKRAQAAKAASAAPASPKANASLSAYFRKQGLTYESPGAAQEIGTRRDPAEVARERALASATRAEFPERAPSIAVGQLVARATGIKTGYQRAQEELNLNRTNLLTTVQKADKEEGAYQTAKRQLVEIVRINTAKKAAGTLGKEDIEQQQTLVGIYKEHNEARKALTKQTEADTRAVDASLKKVTAAAGPLQKIGSVAALFAGAKLFTIALGAASAGFGILERAGGKAIDQMTNFNATSTRVTMGLGAQTKAMHGNIDATYAQASASAGLSDQAAEFLKTQTQGSTMAKAGAIAQGEASDLFRAGLGTRAPTGLYGGYGGLFGTSFLGSEMGGGKGFAEQVLGDLSAYRAQIEAPENLPPQFENYDDAPLRALQGQRLNLLPGPGTNIRDQAGRALEFQTQAVDDLNEAYSRNIRFTGAAGEGLKFVAEAGPGAAKAMENLAKHLTGDAQKTALEMAKNNQAITDSTGQVIERAEQFNKFWENAAAGRTRPTPESLYTQQSWQLRAQFQSQAAASRYQQENRIPGSWGMQMAVNPLQQFAGEGTALSQMLRGTSAGAGAGAGAVQTERAQIQAQGIAAFQNMVANAQTNLRAGGNATGAAELETSMNNVLRLGREIQGVTKQISFISAAQQADEFANSIRLAKRALEDAQGLAGGAGSRLGAIQRQQWELGRESTALGLGMSQRQINFQVAVAGFQAPGITSEERAARMEQAKLEAAYAQKQLDIQKQQFKLAGQEFGITTARAVTDGLKSLGLLRSGRDRSAQLAVLGAQLENLQTKQNLEVAKLNEGLSAADNIFQTKLGVAASAASTLGISLDEATTALDGWMRKLGYDPTGAADTPSITGHAKGRGPLEADDVVSDAQKKVDKLTSTTDKKLNAAEKHAQKTQTLIAKTSASVADVMATYMKAVVDWFNRAFKAVQTASQAWTTDSSGTRRPKESRSGPQEAASGALFTTSGQRTLTVGEAGNETVAVLRNPRNVSATGMGGGGGTVIIQINNPSVRNDGDITALAREVEKVLNRKASLIGLRSIG